MNQANETAGADYVAKTIPASSRRDGWDCNLVSRNGDVAIYVLTKGPAMSWEVCCVKWHAAYSIAGRDFPAGEGLPSVGDWGRLGWTCLTRERATAKARELAGYRYKREGERA
jgi:hypothetical protein